MRGSLATTPFVESVLLATDFSETSRKAFAHALAVALLRKTRLTLLHAGGDRSMGAWQEFPAVRETLERWALLAPGSDRAAVFRELSVSVEKIVTEEDDPVRAIADFVRDEETDLLVLATEGREGLPRWLRPSKAERAAARTKAMTLFVPQDAKGFVSLEDGTISLKRILVPFASQPNANAALIRAARAAEALGDRPVALHLLHVGDGDAPEAAVPDTDVWRVEAQVRQGEPVREIVAAARELDADLLVMATEGRHGLLDALRGSVTQRVLREAPCPLLAVPSI